MNKLKTLTIIFILYITISPSYAEKLVKPGHSSLTKQLSHIINPENTTINFEMDTTWHKIYGEAARFEGEIKSDNFSEPHTVSGKIKIQAASLATGNKRRDNKMKNYSLDVEKFPFILYSISGYKPGYLLGKLTIRDITKPVKLALTIDSTGSKKKYTAKTTIKWKEFGVADPSIFIARVYDKLNITIKTIIENM